MLDEDDDQTAEAGPEKDPDDETLLRRLKRWERLARDHWSAWREEARLAYDFVAGKQWSADDKAYLLDQMRQPVTFNRVAPMVDAVTGAEILNRQEVRYSPREIGDVQVNEIISAADEWARELGDTEDEESDCFSDVVICGMGWTETRMDYSDDPEGRIIDDRIDPLEMLADPMAKKRCLADARYIIRSRWRNKNDLPKKWRARLKDETTANPTYTDDWGHGSSGPRDDYERDDARAVDNASARKDQVWIRHFQWWDKETAYRISDEATGEAITVDRAKLKQINEMFIAHGLKPPEHVQIEQNRYRQAIVAGDTMLEVDDIECEAFTFKAITGKRDRNANIFFGIVRAMIDPQMWGNKFFVQILHILNTAAKGGLMYEAGSFVNPRKALEDWAKPDAGIELQRGALTGQKAAVQERQPAVFPVGLDKLMQFALENLPQTSGINLEMLGLVDRDQPGVLEQQRKKSGYAILAVFFDSLRRYRKMKGRVRLFFIQNYISDGRLIRIKGQDNTVQYVPLVKQPGTATYDVIVDDAPMSPNQKENTWLMMQALMPMLVKLNVPPEVWSIMLEYSPLPSSVSTKINAAIVKQASQPPPPDPDIIKVQAQTQAKQAELQMKAESDARKQQADQEKDAAEFELEKARMANELEVEKTKLALEVEKTRQQLAAQQQKHNMEMTHQHQKMVMENQQHQQGLAFDDERHRREMAHQDRSNANDLAFQERKSQAEIAGKTEQAKIAASAKPAPAPTSVPKSGPRHVSIKRDKTGRMSEIIER